VCMSCAYGAAERFRARASQAFAADVRRTLAAPPRAPMRTPSDPLTPNSLARSRVCATHAAKISLTAERVVPINQATARHKVPAAQIAFRAFRSSG